MGKWLGEKARFLRGVEDVANILMGRDRRLRFHQSWFSFA
jgi:hypothetical protein